VSLARSQDDQQADEAREDEGMRETPDAMLWNEE